MKLFRIESLQVRPSETPITALERIYIQYIPCPPDAVQLVFSAGKYRLLRWEDIAIIHFLPDCKKSKYFHMLVTRDDVLNNCATPADAASYLAALIL